MKDINLCTVVMGKTMDEVIHQVIDCKDSTQFIEFRSDYLNNQKEIDLFLLKSKTHQEIIVTCRRNDEGGKWKGSERDRIGVLQKAFDLGFLVDVELKTLEGKKLRLCRPMQKRAIISFHDFMKTPSTEELKNIIKRMDMFNPHIKKIATMVKDEDDSMRILNLAIQKQKNENLCVIGMGHLGKKTRIIAPLLGSCLTYCSINSEETSAPGQMSCGDMKKIIGLLH